MEEVEKKRLIAHKEDKKIEKLSSIEYFKEAIKLLGKCEASLIYMFVINFCVSIQYYVLVTLIPLYFSSEHRYSDLASGLIFGAFGIIIGFCSIYLSSIISIIGFKRGLYCSIFLGIVGFLMMMTNNDYICLIAVILIQAISCSMAWPFIEYGVKEFSHADVRSLSSSLFFMSNYLAGIISGVLIDFLWIYMSMNRSFMYLIIYLASIAFLLLAVLFIALCKPINSLEEEHMETVGILKQRHFWKFLSLIILLIFLRSTVFGHLDATLPKYLVRVQGKGAHFGVMLAIHSVTMLIGVFTLTTLTYSYSSYTLIVIGGAIGSIGSVLLIFVEGTWAFIVFVVCVSIGESIWVPRLLDYTFSIAPSQFEGVYLAMSNCPFYFGMIITGASSGVMLDSLCPVGNTSKCYLIWLAVFLSSICIPILLVILEPVIKHHSDEEKPLSFNSKSN